MVYSLQEIKNKVEPIAEKYNVQSVYLFGSYARNEATEDSDLDILFVREGSKIRSLFDMGGMYNDLSEAFGKEISLITEEGLNSVNTKQRIPQFINNVKKEKMVLYEG
ncbi:MAG: nucleotidyltransferase domain-containing protein [Oscillospiraceae bacterium]|nr:nucleotidyltransferase domain-containing protein [Oscillospiraceae bacterium]